MADFATGDRFGDYRLQESLGGGGFGDVWRASHVESGDVVALKFLGGQYSEADTARIHAEVELLATAAARSSRHVVRVLDGGTEPVPYVVMEYIGGGDLREEMAERGSLTIEATIEVGRGVFDALRVLDEAGIIHRDIKPANVMRDLDGTVKLTDFGIAKIIGYDTITATGQLPLSMAYAAPESWDGRSSHRSDLYSVGVLLYQCLVGEAPFGGTYAEVYRQHLSQRPDLTRLPGATPPSLRSLIARCLEKEVEARPADATACMQLIDAAASELVDSTDPRGPRHPTRLGPWVIIDHHPTRAWAFRCQHEDTGQEATVEVHFGADLALGAALQRAVAVNAELVPLGAERLLETNRLVLRPGEAWPERTSGRFQFWVAREERSATADAEVAAEVDRATLGRAARALVAVRDRVLEAELPFAPTAVDLLIVGGAVLLLRPGLPASDGAGDAAALAALATWPLTPDARTALDEARSLEELTAAAGFAGGPPGLEAPPVRGEGGAPLRWAAVGLALLAGGIVVAAVLFLLLDTGAGDGEIAMPTTTATPTEVVEQTPEPTAGPGLAPGVVIDDDFSGGAADWTLAGSAALDDGTLVLTTPRANERGIAWLRAPVEGPFVAEFDYRAGGALNSIGGHGLVFMFYKRAADISLGSGCLGFSLGNPCAAAAPSQGGSILEGYGVEFDAHLNGIGSFPGFGGDPSAAHIALVRDSAGQHLVSADDARVEDDAWHTVRVVVDLDRVTVEVDGEQVLTWSGELDRTFGGLGFAATTTASETNWHIIDNVRIEVTGEAPVASPAPAPEETLHLAHLDARSCDLGATAATLDEGAPTWVEFANGTAEPALVFLVTTDELLPIARLEPDARAVQAGAVGERWLVTDVRGDCRAVFEPSTTAPEPAAVWLARITEPAATRVYRNEGLGFEFLRPRDELVQVVAGAAPGLAALSIGERIEIFVVNARGATLEEYAAGALTNVTVDRERLASLDGLPAVVLEYHPQPGSATEAATFLLRDDAAHVFTFRRGATVEGCASDLATYRMLLRSFRFLGDPDAAPTLLPGPDAEVSERLCGDVLTPPAGAEELTDLIASVGCGPLTAGVGDAVVCAPGLSDVATLMCWAVAGSARDCATGPASLTTSFDAPGRHTLELTACTAAGCQTAVATVSIDASTPRPPAVTALGCAPLYPRAGDTVTCTPQVSSSVVAFCWSADVAGFAEDGERCGADSELQLRVGSTSAVVALRACDAEGLCSGAAQLLPVDASMAAVTFLPENLCTPHPVLVGEAAPCHFEGGGATSLSLPPGEHLVALTACLPSAPLQPAVCATYDASVEVAATLARGTIVDAGQAVEGARVDLVVARGGDQTPLLRRAFTDASGRFTLVDPPQGSYRLVVSTEIDGGGWEQRASVEVNVSGSGRIELETIDLAPAEG